MSDAQTPATQMKAPDAKTVKMVRIKALQPIYVNGDMVDPGQVVEVDEKTADQFCKPIQGIYSFDGERSNQTAERHVTKRAERAA